MPREEEFAKEQNVEEIIAYVLPCDAKNSDDDETDDMPCQLPPIREQLHALTIT